MVFVIFGLEIFVVLLICLVCCGGLTCALYVWRRSKIRQQARGLLQNGAQVAQKAHDGCLRAMEWCNRWMVPIALLKLLLGVLSSVVAIANYANPAIVVNSTIHLSEILDEQNEFRFLVVFFGLFILYVLAIVPLDSCCTQRAYAPVPDPDGDSGLQSFPLTIMTVDQLQGIATVAKSVGSILLVFTARHFTGAVTVRPMNAAMRSVKDHLVISMSSALFMLLLCSFIIKGSQTAQDGAQEKLRFAQDAKFGFLLLFGLNYLRFSISEIRDLSSATGQSNGTFLWIGFCVLITMSHVIAVLHATLIAGKAVAGFFDGDASIQESIHPQWLVSFLDMCITVILSSFKFSQVNIDNESAGFLFMRLLNTTINLMLFVFVLGTSRNVRYGHSKFFVVLLIAGVSLYFPGLLLPEQISSELDLPSALMLAIVIPVSLRFFENFCDVVGDGRPTGITVHDALKADARWSNVVNRPGVLGAQDLKEHALTKLVFWHAMQPIAYLSIFFMSWSALDSMQKCLGVIVSIREVAYLTAALYCFYDDDSRLVLVIDLAKSQQSLQQTRVLGLTGLHFFFLYIAAPDLICYLPLYKRWTSHNGFLIAAGISYGLSHVAGAIAFVSSFSLNIPLMRLGFIVVSITSLPVALHFVWKLVCSGLLSVFFERTRKITISQPGELLNLLNDGHMLNVTTLTINCEYWPRKEEWEQVCREPQLKEVHITGFSVDEQVIDFVTCISEIQQQQGTVTFYVDDFPIKQQQDGYACLDTLTPTDWNSIAFLTHFKVVWIENVGKFRNIPLAQLRADRLRQLHLSDRSLGVPGAIVLSHFLRRNALLNYINISKNNIGPVGARFIGEAIAVSISLTTIDISSNKIGPVGAKFIAEAIAVSNSLRSVNISGNEIDPDGATFIFEGVFASFSLIDINISNNNITGDGLPRWLLFHPRWALMNVTF